MTMTAVPIDVQARSAKTYADRANIGMRVCGACGLRDPCDQCEVTVNLLELPDNHWLGVPSDALERLRRQRDLLLLRKTSFGFEQVHSPEPRARPAQPRRSRRCNFPCCPHKLLVDRR